MTRTISADVLDALVEHWRQAAANLPDCEHGEIASDTVRILADHLAETVNGVSPNPERKRRELSDI